MKATDLMIGDWVQNPLGWKAQVQSIRYVNTIKDEWEWLVKIGINNETFQGKLSLNEIGAIPLTPEILEKNGWERSADHLWRHDDAFSLENDFEKGYWVHLFDSPVIYLGYVHELQHALRFFKIEKEIEL